MIIKFQNFNYYTNLRIITNFSTLIPILQATLMTLNKRRFSSW
jgi:hypothetical protein